MKKLFYIIISVFLCSLCLLLPCFVSFAHPGDLDENGGHYDRSTGEYHYHHGYPAHQHENGKCPYDYDDNVNHNRQNSDSDKSKVSVFGIIVSIIFVIAFLFFLFMLLDIGSISIQNLIELLRNQKNVKSKQKKLLSLKTKTKDNELTNILNRCSYFIQEYESRFLESCPSLQNDMLQSIENRLHISINTTEKDLENGLDLMANKLIEDAAFELLTSEKYPIRKSKINHDDVNDILYFPADKLFFIHEQALYFAVDIGEITYDECVKRQNDLIDYICKTN